MQPVMSVAGEEGAVLVCELRLDGQEDTTGPFLTNLLKPQSSLA